MKMGSMWQTLLSTLLVQSLFWGNTLHAGAQSEDYYCGSSFDQALDECPLPCPSGTDSDCSVMGSDYICFYFTGCAAKIAGGFVPAGVAGASEETVTDAPVVPVSETQPPTTKQTSGPDTAGGTVIPVEVDVTESESSNPAPSNLNSEAETPTLKPTPLSSVASTETPTLKPTLLSSVASTSSASDLPTAKQSLVMAAPTSKPTRRNQKQTAAPAIANITLSPVSSSASPSVLLLQDPLNNNTDDSFCGTEYFQAGEDCSLACPLGEDSECISSLGDGYACFLFTGCTDKIANGFVPPNITLAPTPQQFSLGPTPKQPSLAPTPKKPTLFPTPKPTLDVVSPIAGTDAELYIVLTLHNTPDRNMTDDEEQELKNELYKFFSYWRYFDGKWEWSADEIKVLSQQTVEWAEEGRRALEESQNLVSRALTLMLHISYQGPFSKSEIGDGLSILIEENGAELVSYLEGQENYPFFLQVDKLSARTIEMLTTLPDTASQEAAASESTAVETGVTNEAGSSTTKIYAGIGAAAVSFLLVGIGLSYFLIHKRHHTKKGSKRTLDTGDDDIEIGFGPYKTSRVEAKELILSPCEAEEQNNIGDPTDNKNEDGSLSGNDSSSGDENSSTSDDKSTSSDVDASSSSDSSNSTWDDKENDNKKVDYNDEAVLTKLTDPDSDKVANVTLAREDSSSSMLSSRSSSSLDSHLVKKVKERREKRQIEKEKGRKKDKKPNSANNAAINMTDSEQTLLRGNSRTDLAACTSSSSNLLKTMSYDEGGSFTYKLDRSPSDKDKLRKSGRKKKKLSRSDPAHKLNRDNAITDSQRRHKRSASDMSSLNNSGPRRSATSRNQKDFAGSMEHSKKNRALKDSDVDDNVIRPQRIYRRHSVESSGFTSLHRSASTERERKGKQRDASALNRSKTRGSSDNLRRCRSDCDVTGGNKSRRSRSTSVSKSELRRSEKAARPKRMSDLKRTSSSRTYSSRHSDEALRSSTTGLKRSDSKRTPRRMPSSNLRSSKRDDANLSAKARSFEEIV